MSDSDTGDVPPGSPPAVVQAAVHDRDKNAGIVSRGIAGGFDLLAVSGILASVYLGFVVLQLVVSVRGFTVRLPHLIFTLTGFLVVSVLYLTTCWAVSGRTLGAVVMGLRVVNRKGLRLSPVTAGLRALICTFFAVGLLWAAVDSKRRSVADLMLRTRVVYSR